ncbi:MAG: amidohydrolase family protein [Candidatus Paceibacterota bacterium]|jgi:hypothetical protein
MLETDKNSRKKFKEKGRTLIIDIHAHTSNHQMKGLHVTSATIATLEELAKQYGISAIILLATYFPHRGTGVHNHDLLKRIEGRPLFRMFGSLNVINGLRTGIDELEKLAQLGLIAGIKLYPGYQSFEPSETQLVGIYQLAETYRLPVMLHGGELHRCPKEWNELSRPKYVEKPARDFPKVKFVVSHLSNPHFEELREVMTRCPNVFTDISGQFVSGAEEDMPEYRKLIVEEIQKFLLLPNGEDRVMFATDFPIQSYEDSLDLVWRLKLSEVGLKKILAGNAIRFLDRTHAT